MSIISFLENPISIMISNIIIIQSDDSNNILYFIFSAVSSLFLYPDNFNISAESSPNSSPSFKPLSKTPGVSYFDTSFTLSKILSNRGSISRLFATRDCFLSHSSIKTKSIFLSSDSSGVRSFLEEDYI